MTLESHWYSPRSFSARRLMFIAQPRPLHLHRLFPVSLCRSPVRAAPLWGNYFTSFLLQNVVRIPAMKPAPLRKRRFLPHTCPVQLQGLSSVSEEQKNVASRCVKQKEQFPKHFHCVSTSQKYEPFFSTRTLNPAYFEHQGHWDVIDWQYFGNNNTAPGETLREQVASPDNNGIS